MLKITKYNDYRLNFVLDGLHYSLSENDGFEKFCKLRCKEKDFVISFGYHSFDDIISMFIKDSFKQGCTYSQMIYIDKLEEFVRELLNGVEYIDTKAYKQNLKIKKIRKVNKCLEELTELNYKVVSFDVYEQIVWERDIAIDQLKQLGYGFGEKIDKLSDKQRISELEDVIASLNCQYYSFIDELYQIIFEGEDTNIGRKVTIDRIKELVYYNE